MSLYEKTKAKEILVDKSEIIDLVKNTIGGMATLVGSTLGPAGRTVLIERDNLSPLITKDGVTVAKSIGYQDATKNVIVEAAKEICLNTGKEAGDGPQPLYSKILTPTGFTTMGEIKVGDKICGTDGSKQEVLGVYPKGEKEVYEVYFSDGRIVECCEDHLWSTYNYLNKHKIRTTKEIMEDVCVKYKDGRIRNKYYTPKTKVEFYKNDGLPLDPYLVGVLLGDGALSENGSIELSLGLNKEHIIDKIILPNGFKLNVQEIERENRQTYFRVKISGKSDNGETIHKLVESLELLNTKSDTKFIPKCYIYSDTNTREALLMGLLDTDGYINKRGLFEFSTVSEQLCKDFLELTRGLGLTVSYWLQERKDGDGSYSTKPIYRIVQHRGYERGDKIIEIKKTNKIEKMQCIKVSNSDNLYITDGYITTHNTTSAIVLANEFISNGINYLQENAKEENPQAVARELSWVFENKITEIIKKYSTPIKTQEEMRDVALISSNGDEIVSGVVVEAIMSAGEGGHVVILEDLGGKTRCEYIDGYIITSALKNLGPLGTMFINDKSGQQCKMDNGFVLLYNGEINDHAVIKKLEVLINSYPSLNQAPFVIMAHNFSDSVMEVFAKIFKSGTIMLPIKTPQYATTTSRTLFLQDMAAYTNGQMVDPSPDPFNIDDLGTFREVRANLYECVVYADNDDVEEREKRVKERILELNAIHDAAPSEFDKSIIKGAINRISGGVSTIFVGGITELEIRERKARVEDAVEAVRSAIDEGIVPGGATMYLAIKTHLAADPDKKPSWYIIIKSLEYPIWKILDNGGIKEAPAIIEKLNQDIKEDKINTIFDVNKRTFVKADESQIIEPSKVIRVVLGNSISVASMLITLGGVVVIPRDLSAERQIDLQRDVMKGLMSEMME
jgi:chaperonin GroEL (HSP60 family)